MQSYRLLELDWSTEQSGSKSWAIRIRIPELLCRLQELGEADPFPAQVILAMTEKNFPPNQTLIQQGDMVRCRGSGYFVPNSARTDSYCEYQLRIRF